jgi:hypothetical protein
LAQQFSGVAVAGLGRRPPKTRPIERVTELNQFANMVFSTSNESGRH